VFDWWKKMAQLFSGPDAVGVIPESGRSSVQTVGGGIPAEVSGDAVIPAPFDFSVFHIIERLWFSNPDLSQATLNLISIANTGHEVLIPGATDQRATRAIERLNLLAARLFPEGGGVDGLLNLHFTQLALWGALSSEAEVDFKKREVRRLIPVPVKQIRFTFDAEAMATVPNQQAPWVTRSSSNGLIRLAPSTYRYLGWLFYDDSPYAKPPFSAAVEKIESLQDTALDSLGQAIQKHRFLGFTQISVTPPPRKAGEIDSEYAGRLRRYLSDIVENVREKITKSGLLVNYRDQQVTHTKVDTNTTGISDLITVIEQQVMSGFGQQGVFFGRSDSSTETFADVVYQLLLAQCANLQRLCAMRLEHAYALDLFLGGLSLPVEVKFNAFHQRKPLEAAQARQTEWTTALGKVQAGLLSPQQAAQSLGLDSWFDESKLLGGASRTADTGAALRLAYRRGSNRYEFVRDRYELSSVHRHAALALTEEEIDRLAEEFVAKYLSALGGLKAEARQVALEQIRSFLAGASFNDFETAQAFAERVFEIIRSAYSNTFSSTAAGRIYERTVREVYEFYRLRDNSPFGGENPPVALKFGGPDTRSLKFIASLDGFYFSKFVDNNSKTTKDFLVAEYLEKGAALFGRGTPEDLDDFRAAVGGRLDDVADFHVETIIRTAVQRTRNWAHFQSLRQGKFRLARIIAVLDSATSSICRSLDGKFIPVGAAAETIDRLSTLSPGEFAADVYETEAAKEYRRDPVGFTSKFLDENDVISEDLIKTGLGFPPYHPRCRTRVQGVFE
jgi:hypothetical protein